MSIIDKTLGFGKLSQNIDKTFRFNLVLKHIRRRKLFPAGLLRQAVRRIVPQIPARGKRARQSSPLFSARIDIIFRKEKAYDQSHPGLPTQFTFYHPIAVRYADLDTHRHVNNISILEYVETARTAYYQVPASGTA